MRDSILEEQSVSICTIKEVITLTGNTVLLNGNVYLAVRMYGVTCHKKSVFVVTAHKLSTLLSVYR